MNLALSEHLPLIASAPEGIQKLRELILDLAVRGKLVPQDPNDEPANDLLEQIKQKRAQLETGGACKKSKKLPPLSKDEQPFALPHNWTWTRLGEVTNFGYADKNGEISEFTWVLDLEDIQKNTSELLKKVRFSERPAKSDKNRFQPGDVLYGKLRPYLNKIIIADEEGVCTTEILPVRGYLGVHPPYLMHAMKRPDFLAYVNAKSYGMKMPRLGTDDGRLAPFPLAPINEQHRIATKVDELMALCDRLESEQNDSAAAHTQLVETLLGTLTQSTDAADFEANWKRIAEHFDTLFTTEASIDALRKSILQFAVMGKLVRQDPNDEPVAELLCRLSNNKNGAGSTKFIAEVTDTEKPFAIPDSWYWVRVATFGTTQTGTTPKKSEPSLFGTDYPFIKPGDISVTGSINYDNEGLSDAGATASGRIADPQSILMVCIGTIGKCGMIDRSCSFNQQINSVTPVEDTSDFVLLALQSPYFQNEAWERSSSTTLSILNKGKWESIPIPLPPLPEQKRIVSKIDDLFQKIDQLRNLITKRLAATSNLSDQLISDCINYLNQPANQSR